MHFSRQMAAFVRAGIPILDALEVLEDDASNKRCKQMLIEITRCAAQRRRPSSDAMAEHASIFPPYYIGILRSAELTGHLDVVLEQLAELHRARPRDDARDQVGADLPVGHPGACRSSP